MKTTKLSEKSNEQLIKYQKVIAILVSMLIVACVLLLIVTIYQKNFVLMIIPFSMIPILLINVYSFINIKKELKSRNL